MSQFGRQVKDLAEAETHEPFDHCARPYAALPRLSYFRKLSRRPAYDFQIDSGEPAKISKKVGGKFTAWGSHLSGINLVLKPGKKIVQAWRATGWWPDHYSIATFDITKVRGGSKLKFMQIGIPPNRYSGHYRGWIETYWRPMKEVFATGARPHIPLISTC